MKYINIVQDINREVKKNVGKWGLTTWNFYKLKRMLICIKENGTFCLLMTLFWQMRPKMG